jgi:hypothetical protein
MNDALLPGEKVLAARPANLMFGFDQAAKLPDGRKPLGPAAALEQLVRSVPVTEKTRAISGKVSISNYRLYFASGRINTTRGTVSIFLPSIVYDEPVTGAFAGQWVVKTLTLSYRFAVRDARELSQLLRQTREKALDVPALREHVTQNLDKVSSGLGALWPRKDLQKVIESKEVGSLQVVGLTSALELFTE